MVGYADGDPGGFVSEPPVAIRPEEPGDAAAIGDILRVAFGGGWEAALVDRLRAARALPLALVAAAPTGEVVGHVAFSPLPIATATGTLDALALAPLAVRPEWQRRGVGTLLGRAALDRLRSGGAPLVVVLGDPAWYGRFGFRAEAAAGIRCPYSGPALQALALGAREPAGIVGDAAYHPAFAE